MIRPCWFCLPSQTEPNPEPRGLTNRTGAARRDGVTVLPARMLARYLSRRRPAISAQEAGEIGEALRLALEVDGG